MTLIAAGNSGVGLSFFVQLPMRFPGKAGEWRMTMASIYSKSSGEDEDKPSGLEFRHVYNCL